MAETPEEKFVRLATARVNKVLKQIEGVGKLNAPAYKHDKRAERFGQIKRTLLDAVERAIPDGQGGSENDATFKLT